jgi:hypothetical protein
MGAGIHLSPSISFNQAVRGLPVLMSMAARRALKQSMEEYEKYDY